MYPNPQGQPFTPVYAPVPLPMGNPYTQQYSYAQYGNYQPFMNQPQPQYPYNYTLSFGSPMPQQKFNPYNQSGFGSYNNPFGDLTGRPAVQSNGIAFKDTPTVFNGMPTYGQDGVMSSGSQPTSQGYDGNYIYDNKTGEYRPADGSQYFAQTDVPVNPYLQMQQQPQQPQSMIDFVHRGQQAQAYNSWYNPYSFNTYGMNPMAQQQRADNAINIRKLKLRLMAGYFGRTISDDNLDILTNPSNPVNVMPQEDQECLNQYRMLQQLNQLSLRPVQPMSKTQYDAACMAAAQASFDQTYGNDDMFTFFNKTSWRILNEIYEHENYVDNSRNLGRTYNSAEFNELLNMHNSSNPYINQLMDDSRYDNNQDDLEVGLNLAFERAKRRQSIMNGPANPSGRYLTTPEMQKKREAWTQTIMNQILSKGKPPDG